MGPGQFAQRGAAADLRRQTPGLFLCLYEDLLQVQLGPREIVSMAVVVGPHLLGGHREFVLHQLLPEYDHQELFAPLVESPGYRLFPVYPGAESRFYDHGVGDHGAVRKGDGLGAVGKTGERQFFGPGRIDKVLCGYFSAGVSVERDTALFRGLKRRLVVYFSQKEVPARPVYFDTVFIPELGRDGRSLVGVFLYVEYPVDFVQYIVVETQGRRIREFVNGKAIFAALHGLRYLAHLEGEQRVSHVRRDIQRGAVSALVAASGRSPRAARILFGDLAKALARPEFPHGRRRFVFAFDQYFVESDRLGQTFSFEVFRHFFPGYFHPYLPRLENGQQSFLFEPAHVL